MHQIEQLADVFAKWVKDVPHLPKELTSWLAKNAWWLTIVGVVIGAIGLLTTLGVIMAGSALLVGLGAAALGGMLFVSSLVTLVVTALSVVIEGLAIAPLKSMQRKGWDLLFLSMAVSVVGGFIGSLIGGNFFGAIVGLVFGAVAFYVLNEVRHHFAATAHK